MVAFAAALNIPQSWESISASIQVEQSLIDGLVWSCRVALLLTILVIVAGTTSTVIQIVRQDSHKAIVGICGAATVALTTINGLVFPLSPKEMADRVSKANVEMRGAFRYMQINELPTTGGERLEHLAKVSRYLENVEVIVNGASPAGANSQVAAGSLVRAAYAAEEPAWPERLPRLEGVLYFIGKGESDSIDGARADSMRLARQEAQRAILDQLPAGADSSKIAEVIATSGGIADTNFSSSIKDNRTIYSYNTLYVIKRTNLEFYLRSSGADLEKALAAVQKETSYYRQRWESSAAALDVARDKLGDDEYRALLDGRAARRDKDYPGCVKVLSPAVKPGNVAWYLGWFNLGLAYWNLHEDSDARDALEEAIRLEPQLVVRDASIYNSYGQFLVEHAEYAKGVKILQKALAIDPEIAGAQYALRVASSKLGEGTAGAMKAENVR